MMDHSSVTVNNHNRNCEMQGNVKLQDAADIALPQLLELIDEKPVEESDEETIATFITAAGQQLALYAVEDSEEIFAVAVYDESGEPPTDFQFLMKSDVEKLIGEGAVKTVKKPSQLKQQIYKMGGVMESDDHLMESNMVLPQKEIMDSHNSATTNCIKREENEVSHSLNDSGDDLCQRNFLDENVELNYSNTDWNNKKWPNHIHLMIDDDTAFLEQSQQDEIITDEIQNEFIERSTVQYILSEDPRDYSDLTLDDIEKVLSRQNQSNVLKCDREAGGGNDNKNFFIKVKNVDKESDPRTNPLGNTINAKTNELLESMNNNVHPVAQTKCSIDRENNNDAITELSNNKTVNVLRIKRPRKQQLTIVNRTDSEIIIQAAPIMTSFDGDGNNYRDYSKKTSRRKRRKDSKMNRKSSSYSGTKRGVSVSSGNRNGRKSYRIEVIDIDMDDLDKEIITLEEDGKEKGSSDKENDVIMVGDSDDEINKVDEKRVDHADNDADDDYDDDDNDSDYHDKTSRKTTRRRSLRKTNKSNLFECRNCNRQYRQKRALDSHSRVCFKSQLDDTMRTATIRSRRLTDKSSSNWRDSTKKQYECKTCHERFEVVVALARHVRLTHSLKKKNTQSISSVKIDPTKRAKMGKRDEALVRKRKFFSTSNTKCTELYSVEDGQGQSHQKKFNRLEKRTTFSSLKNREIDLNRKVSMKKVQCNNCGRWCSSITLLLIHSLQHVTKKRASEKSKNQACRRCKKTFRSSFLYIIHHLYNHNDSHVSKRKIRRAIIPNQFTKKILHEKYANPPKL